MTVNLDAARLLGCIIVCVFEREGQTQQQKLKSKFLEHIRLQEYCVKAHLGKGAPY